MSKCLSFLVSLAIVIMMTACGSDDSPTLTAPSTQGGVTPGALQSPVSVDPGVPTGIVTVKASAPVSLSPTDGARVSSGPIDLTVASPTSTYNVQWTFDVRYEVFDNANPTVVVHSGLVTQGQTTTTYTVPAGALPVDTLYVWRARAESQGESGPSSAIFSFTVEPFNIAPPVLLQPVGGIVTSTLKPSFTVQNGEVTGAVGTVLIEAEVALDSLFADISQVGRTTARDRGETVVPISQNLLPETTYYWRARGTNEHLPVTGVLSDNGPPIDVQPAHSVGDIWSDWSDTATFVTPEAGAVGTFAGAGSSPNAPFTTNGGDPANLFSVVNSVALSNPGTLTDSCQEDGGTWEFMDRVVEALRAIDGRWGYNCKRGNCNDVSIDVVNYYRGSQTNTQAAQGSTSVQIIDIILGHCGPNPTAGWLDQTEATRQAGTVGGFKYPR